MRAMQGQIARGETPHAPGETVPNHNAPPGSKHKHRNLVNETAKVKEIDNQKLEKAKAMQEEKIKKIEAAFGNMR